MLAGCIGSSTSTTETKNGSLKFSTNKDVLRVERDDNTVETIVFKLTNNTTKEISINPDNWEIRRAGQRNAEAVISGENGNESRSIPEKDEYTWVLSRRSHPSPKSELSSNIFAELNEGAYVFAFHGLAEGADRVLETEFRVDIVGTPTE
jgi:hypothetical protein